MDSGFHFLQLALQVFLLDLLLSGDNAVVIALACRSLPEREKRQAVFLGTAAAIVLRVLLTLVANLVLQIPFLKLVGGVALLVIAIQLVLEEDEERADANGGRMASVGLMAAVNTIVVADLVMSTDNVLALAAVARGSVPVLVLGLLLSVPLLMFGSLRVTALLERYPVLIRLGGALLGWLAGDILVSDPLYASWVEQQSPALALVVPAALAVYVLVQSRIIEERRARAQPLRPARRVKPEPEPEPEAPDLPADVAAVQPAEALPETVLAEATPEGSPESLADGPPAAGPAPAAIQDENESLQQVRWIRHMRWLVAVAVALPVIGLVMTLKGRGLMPQPEELVRYDCQSRDISVYYRHGAQQFRVSAGNKALGVLLRPDLQIDWTDYAQASQMLGFAPPTHVAYVDARTLQIHGGVFDHVVCTHH